MRKKIGGVNQVAKVLAQLDSSVSEGILEQIEQKSPDLIEAVREQMFTFNDLLRIDGQGFQVLVRTVPKELWKLALKTASPQVKSLVWKNMSDRQAKMLQEDMDNTGPVRRSDVESAQKDILSLVKKLESDGKLVILKKGETFV